MIFKKFLPALLAVLLLPACKAEEGPEAPCQIQFMAMDTIMTFTLYGEDAQSAAVLGKQRVQELEALLSVTAEGSDLDRVNHAAGQPVELSAGTRQLLADALALCASTDGALDVTMYPVVRAWGFTTGEYRVPESDELSALLERVDFARVSLEGNTLTIPADMELDLGAVAKGFTGDQLMELFAASGVTSAIVELGGNIQTLGAKPDGSPWRVAVQSPDGGYAGALEIIDKAAVTSGGYQRYFEQDGETYWHIMDPATGRPARSGLVSVTIVTDRGVEADGLSTALFVMGKDRAAAYWKTHPGFDFILIDEDGCVTVTEGLENSFSLYGDWIGSPLEIICR